QVARQILIRASKPFRAALGVRRTRNRTLLGVALRELRHQSRRMSSIEAVESPNSRAQPLSELKPLIDSMRNFLAKRLCGLACADGSFLMAPDCRGPNAEDVFYWGFVLRPELLKAL